MDLCLGPGLEEDADGGKSNVPLSFGMEFRSVGRGLCLDVPEFPEFPGFFYFLRGCLFMDMGLIRWEVFIWQSGFLLVELLS